MLFGISTSESDSKPPDRSTTCRLSLLQQGIENHALCHTGIADLASWCFCQSARLPSCLGCGLQSTSMTNKVRSAGCNCRHTGRSSRSICKRACLIPLNAPFCPASELCADLLRGPRAGGCKDAASLLRVLTIAMNRVRSRKSSCRSLEDWQYRARCDHRGLVARSNAQQSGTALTCTVPVHRNSAHPCMKALSVK